MTSDGARTAVTMSAVVVGGIYGYQKLSDPAGTPPVAHFLIGFTFIYVTLGILAEAAPALGGMFAALVAVGDLLANGQAFTRTVTTGLKATAQATTKTAA